MVGSFRADESSALLAAQRQASAICVQIPREFGI
jgi:hypothetical protein